MTMRKIDVRSKMFDFLDTNEKKIERKKGTKETKKKKWLLEKRLNRWEQSKKGAKDKFYFKPATLSIVTA